MVFSVLDEAANRGELILMEAGMLRFHRRRDGVVTIHEAIVLPNRRRKGVGRCLVESIPTGGVRHLTARCPEEYESNAFWEAIGFRMHDVDTIRSGKRANVWRLDLI